MRLPRAQSKDPPREHNREKLDFPWGKGHFGDRGPHGGKVAVAVASGSVNA